MNTFSPAPDSGMTLMLHQMPLTLWPPVIAAILTAAATLFGVWITNQSHKQRLDLQLTHQLQERNREITRDKLEEAYILFNKFYLFLSSIYLARTGVMAGQSDLKSTLSNESENIERNQHDFTRLDMLVDLYFPSFKSDYEQFIEARNAVNKLMMAHQSQYLSGNRDGRNLIQPFLNAQEDFDMKADNFKGVVIAMARALMTE